MTENMQMQMQKGTAAVEKSVETSEKSSLLQRASNFVTTSLETLFYRVGRIIGNHPWITILISSVIVGLFGIGMVRFTETTDNMKLWVPADALIRTHIEWVKEKFPSSRFLSMIFVHENVLQATVINSIYDVYKNSLDISTTQGRTFADICYKSGPSCVVTSLLVQWNYNEMTIQGLSDVNIKNKINDGSNSATRFLGKMKFDDAGDITGAEATFMTWLLQNDNSVKNDVMNWEEKTIELAQKGQSGISKIFVFASRTFGDEARASIQSDVTLISGGYGLIIIYVAIVLGRFNAVEHRAGLAFSGILCIGLSILFSFGFASACGWEYGPLHSILPFLLLGIGVDDMFVVIGALNNLTPAEQSLGISEKAGKMLKHAGVSITVTSLTDVVAFAVGATSVLPALRSFCVFASLGILALYFLQVTFFVACITIDASRIAAERDACICCYTHKNYQLNKCSKKELLPKFFTNVYTPLLLKLPIKIIVTVLTAALLGMNVWGMVNLKQNFDPSWFLPIDSYAQQYLQASEDYFPDDGASSGVYCGNIDYFSNKDKMEKLYNDMASNQYIYSDSIDSWFRSYTAWLLIATDPAVQAQLDANNYPVNANAFVTLLKDYVESTGEGQKYNRHISFKSDPSLHIDASRVYFKHKDMTDSSSEVKAMDSARNLVEGIGFPESKCFAYSERYSNWETNKIIKNELYRNLGLAAACVFIVTFVLIAHIGSSILVFTCVAFTLIDCAGSMHLWGLTIDTVTSVILIVAIGLAVDYSAHIGHYFMTVAGSRKLRAQITLREMGPPVFNGGFSTLLAFVLLVGSNSYVFITFFKVFLLVVVYGLFHGLVYLPVILSWVGPKPYLSADQTNKPISQSVVGVGSSASDNENDKN